MIKNFLKNNPIHKKIVPRLDYLMLLRPTLFFSVWVMICIGMYISSILSKNIEMNIVNYNIETLFIFFGISMVCGSTFIINQLSDIESDRISHDNLVKFYGLAFDQQPYLLITEFCGGEELPSRNA